MGWRCGERKGVEKKGVKKVGERYLRWILEAESRTPGYMVREELQRERL